MANGKIDPGFVAAPFFGPSSYDPVQAVQRVRLERLQYGQALKEKRDKDFEAGKKLIDLDIKGWEDQQGYDEISGELENLKDQYVELGSKGYNIYDPSSGAERKIAKAFRTKLADIKQKHDVWQQEKATIGDVEKIINQQAGKPEEERDIDINATQEQIDKWMKAEGGVLGRSPLSKELIVGKARPVDAGKYFQAAIPKFVPGTDKTVSRFIIDETTGKWGKSTWEGVDPARAKAGILKAYKAAPTNIKNAVDKMFEADPEKGVMNKEDWIMQNYGPEYPVKKGYEQGISGTGGMGAGYGIPEKDTTGNYPVQPQVRDIYYNTSSKSGDKVVPYEGVGRIPIAATFGFKNITIMGSANNINAITGQVEGKGKAIPAVPVEANMYPVATKAMAIKVKDPRGTEMITETIKPGERIPLHVLEQIRLENASAREQGMAPPHQIQYKPYIHFGLSYKQVKEGQAASLGDQFNIYMPDSSGRTQSYTETSIVPYDEVKQDLFTAAKENKQDWTPYDKYINDMETQLNSTSKINNLFEDKTKTTEDLFKALEQ